MTGAAIALTAIFAIITVGAFVGIYAGSHRKMDLEQWTVGGRGFSLILVWLLMAGEIYTTFTFLGGSGWAYSKGAPVLYILAYQPLMYVVSFFILPQIWELGHQHRLQTQPDFFKVRYGSKYLEAFVALAGVAFMIPYLQIQITGLGVIVEVASYGAIHRVPAMVISFTIVAAFVLTSGVRGVAWVSVIKDLLLLFTAVFIGFAIPHHYFGGIGRMLTALALAKPQHMVMPGSTPDLGHSWFVTTVIMVACSFYMWPQYFGAAFTAKSADTLRRNAVVMPLYSATVPLMFFVGFTAVLVLPNLPNENLSLLTLVRQTFPAWFLGVIGGAGALTAMVPAAIQVLTAATLFIKNFCRPMLAPSLSDFHVARFAKVTVLILTALTLYFAIYRPASLVSLLLIGYAGVSQFFPGVVFGLFSKRVNAAGVFAGMVAGVAIASSLMLTNHDPYKGLNAGFLALCCNLAIVTLATLLRPATVPAPSDAVPLPKTSPA
jgi:SSS family solute:Na+ symporter